MTARNRRLAVALFVCATLLVPGLGHTARAQGRKPAGPPKNPDGYLAIAVVYDDGGPNIVKSDKVAAKREKRVDFYLLNLTNDDLEFAVEFSRGGKSTWICDTPGAKQGVGKRPADGTISCKLDKTTVENLCGNDDPCLVDFKYVVTKAGGTVPIVADPQLEIRR
jgi:hypothetical protein